MKREPGEPTPAAPAAKAEGEGQRSVTSSSTRSTWRAAAGMNGVERLRGGAAEKLEKWMPRQEVRGQPGVQGVEATGLLDHVLKSIRERKVMLVKLDKHKNPAGAALAGSAHSPAAEQLDGAAGVPSR